MPYKLYNCMELCKVHEDGYTTLTGYRDQQIRLTEYNDHSFQTEITRWRIRLHVCEDESLKVDCIDMPLLREPKGARIGPMKKLEVYMACASWRMESSTQVYRLSLLNLVGLVVAFSYVRKIVLSKLYIGLEKHINNHSVWRSHIKSLIGCLLGKKYLQG